MGPSCDSNGTPSLHTYSPATAQRVCFTYLQPVDCSFTHALRGQAPRRRPPAGSTKPLGERRTTLGYSRGPSNRGKSCGQCNELRSVNVSVCRAPDNSSGKSIASSSLAALDLGGGRGTFCPRARRIHSGDVSPTILDVNPSRNRSANGSKCNARQRRRRWRPFERAWYNANRPGVPLLPTTSFTTFKLLTRVAGCMLRHDCSPASSSA